MRPDEVPGNPGDRTPAEEAAAAEARLAERLAGELPKKCGGCVRGLVHNPNTGRLERHDACGGEGVRR